MATSNNPDAFDYEIWAPATKTTLIEKGLWDVVENGVPPDPSKVPEYSATVQAEELSRWRDLAMKDMEAIQVLQSTLTDSVFRKTLSASSAKEVWDLLEKSDEEAKLRRLENQFERLSMGENESVDSYFDRVNEIVEQLRRLKIEKSDYEVIKKVLGSLSGSYDNLAPMLEELMDVHKMTFENLVEFFHNNGSITEEDIHLMLKAKRLESESENKNKNNSKQGGLFSMAAELSGPSQYRLNKDGEFEYVEKGHKAKDCPVETEAQVNDEEEEEEIVVEYVMMAEVAAGDYTYDEDMWMIYGHATNHITPYEKLFTALDRTYKAKVGLVDGTVLMVEGRGDVKIMMKEGKKKTINNVLFVPRGINRNVLSVPQMSSRGCSLKMGVRGECVVRDMTGAVFGDTAWDFKRGLSMRLQVIEKVVISPPLD